MGFFKDAIRVFGLDMDTLADEAASPLDRGRGHDGRRRRDIDRILNARAIGGRQVVRDGGFTFIDGQRVRRDGPFTYVGDDRVRSENGMTFIGDKQVTREGGFLYLDGKLVEE